jgi:hypothetical protein
LQKNLKNSLVKPSDPGLFSFFILYTDVPTLSDEINDNLEGEIANAELTASIKRMKNEKSPGSDGFTSEFFKFFIYSIFKRLIGRQFFINCLGLSPFGIQVIMPCFCVIDN